MAAMCLDMVDNRDLIRATLSERKGIVRTLDEFLARHSTVNRSIQCSGRW